MSEKIGLSIVTSLYKSAPFLGEFIAELREALNQIQVENIEVILVNDGSPDNSLAKALELQKDFPEITVVNFSRNFGHHQALKAGIDLASGEYIYLCDCDLEIAPAKLVEFYKKIKDDPEMDMIYGVQDRRRGSLFSKLSGAIFYKLMNAISDTAIPENMLTERIFNQKVKQALLSMGDHHLFLGAMLHWIGFKNDAIVLKKGERAGKSTYTTAKRIQLMINAISSFSGRPLLWLFYLGIVLSLISFISAAVIIIMKIRLGDAIQIGWSSLIVLGIFGVGIISTFQGIIGIYLHKMFQQVQNRPGYIISDIYKS
ncbi:glycosyltransferase family 2 protein [bacterium]|nr:glycosyltransferase family 2 protein [bacterium]